jgi:beta-galactosidase
MPPAERRIRLGAAYYPEQSPRERWPLDARLMGEAGLSLVRLGEFAWAELEPAPGRFDFDWLEEAIDLFARQGIDVVLGTPTATPPIWLVRAHPDILPIAADGELVGFGNRRHYCPNAPAFLDATERIVGALGKRFGSDPRVCAWQIDNELGGRCYCDHCARAFRMWLERRYGAVDALNEAWGTTFWGQRYELWEDVELPAADPIPEGGFGRRAPNPGLALDYRRFVSDTYIGYLTRQATLLRSLVRPEQSITHNLMGFGFPEIDYEALARELDFVSWDNYPALDPTDSWTRPALSADAMRGLQGRRVWVMEQQVGPVGWEYVHTSRRGELRVHAHQAVAHGAEALVFFRWQTARFGTEQHWFGVVEADGTVGRRYDELRQLAEELDLDALDDAEPHADVAVVYDYDSRFALQVQPTNVALGHEATVHSWYAALRKLGLGVDVVPAGRDLSDYRLVVAPSLPVVAEPVAARLQEYVDSGGTLVVGPHAGVREPSGAVPERRTPALLDGLLGIRVTDIASRKQRVVLEGTISGTFDDWFEELDVADATALATYADGDFAGGVAISERRTGLGAAVYVAGAAGGALLESVFRLLAERLGLQVFELPAEVELIPLRRSGEELVFAINYGDSAQGLDLANGSWRDLIGGTVGDRFVIPKLDVLFLRREEDESERAVGDESIVEATR